MRGLDELAQRYAERGINRGELDVLRTIARDQEQFRCLAQRRLFGEPMEYLVGSVQFLGRTFKVDKRVYVPNTETEQLVRYALERIQPNAKVLEVGTGCGNIGISIACERPDVKVIAADVDAQALEVAMRNAEAHSVPVEFFESSYTYGIPEEHRPDVVIADLPWGNESYVLHAEGMKKLAHMPEVALFHPNGIYAAQQELLASLEERGWHPTVFLETGLPPEEEFLKVVPKNAHAKRTNFGEYSITEVNWL